VSGDIPGLCPKAKIEVHPTGQIAGAKPAFLRFSSDGSFPVKSDCQPIGKSDLIGGAPKTAELLTIQRRDGHADNDLDPNQIDGARPREYRLSYGDAPPLVAFFGRSPRPARLRSEEWVADMEAARRQMVEPMEQALCGQTGWHVDL
jgi:hypothetical protein